jgi:hypothetical protein
MAADLADVMAVAAKKAAVLELLHGKAKKALVTAAQDTRFAEYFHAHAPGERARRKPAIDRIALNVQRQFRVAEMCLIDAHGAEISRIVGDKVADDLDTDEKGAIFFAAGFALPQRKVHVSPIYLSGDANKWVLAYVTPIVLGDEKPAILHYEHDLAVYQRAVTKELSGDKIFVQAVSSDGWVVADSRKTIATAKRDAAERHADYFKQFQFNGLDAAQLRQRLGESGAAVIATPAGRYAVAYKPAENWTLFAFARQ